MSPIPSVPIQDLSNQRLAPDATQYTDQASDDDSGGIHLRELGACTPLQSITDALESGVSDDGATYYFRQGHVVHLEGKITVPSLSSNDLVLTLPEGFRPVRDHVFAIPADAGGLGVVKIEADGELRWLYGAAGAYWLSGIHFLDPWGKS